MHRRAWLGTGLGLSVSNRFAWAAAPQSEAGAEAVLGVAGPISGPTSAFGLDMAAGARMAVDELQAARQAVGGRPVRWRAMVEDDQNDPRQATAVAQKFADARVQGVIGHLSSGCCFAASRIYERAGIPMITPAATDPRLARQGFKTFFRIIADDDAIAPGLAHYAAHDLGLRRVAIVDDRSAYGQSVASGFARAARRAGMSIVGREYTSDRSTDFSAVLTRLRARRPELLFYGGNFAQAGPMLRQIAGLGLDVRFMGGDFLCAPELARLAGSAVNIAVCASSGIALQRMPAGKAWKQRFDKRRDANAYQAFAPYAYDAVMVLAHAMDKAGSTQPARYLGSIRDVDMDGVTRRRIRFGPDGNLAQPEITLIQFRQGRMQAVAVRAGQAS